MKRNSGYRRHKLGKKTAKRKRDLRQAKMVSVADQERMKRLLPYA